MLPRPSGAVYTVRFAAGPLDGQPSSQVLLLMEQAGFELACVVQHFEEPASIVSARRWCAHFDLVVKRSRPCSVVLSDALKLPLADAVHVLRATGRRAHPTPAGLLLTDESPGKSGGLYTVSVPAEGDEVTLSGLLSALGIAPDSLQGLYGEEWL